MHSVNRYVAQSYAGRVNRPLCAAAIVPGIVAKELGNFTTQIMPKMSNRKTGSTSGPVSDPPMKQTKTGEPVTLKIASPSTLPGGAPPSTDTETASSWADTAGAVRQRRCQQLRVIETEMQQVRRRIEGLRQELSGLLIRGEELLRQLPAALRRRHS
jgi:hypothetical protein